MGRLSEEAWKGLTIIHNPIYKPYFNKNEIKEYVNGICEDFRYTKAELMEFVRKFKLKIRCNTHVIQINIISIRCW